MASEWLDPQAKQKVYYNDMSAGNLQILVLSIFQAIYYFSGYLLLLLRYFQARAIFRTQLAELPHRPGGSIPPCKQALKNNYK